MSTWKLKLETVSQSPLKKMKSVGVYLTYTYNFYPEVIKMIK